jgi:hypothetical protein
MTRRKRKPKGRPQHPKGMPNRAMSTKVGHQLRTTALLESDAVLDPELPKLPTLEELERIVDAQTELVEGEAALRAAVHEAKAAGHTWRSIGNALGVSAQAAHKRYHLDAGHS